MEQPLTPTRLSAATGISLPYASQIISGKRAPSRPLAIRLYRMTGRKFGPIAHLSEDDIAVLERIDLPKQDAAAA